MKSCTFIGYVENTTKQYRVQNGQRIVVVASLNIRLDEESYRYKDYKQAPNPTAQDVLIRHFPTKQEVLEEQVEDLLSTNQPPLQSGQASMTTELTLQTNAQFDPPIAAHPTTKSTGMRRFTCEKHPSFKLRSAFSARIWTLFKLASYQEVGKHLYSQQQERAIKEELKALDKNKTQDLVDKDTILKSRKRVISCKQVYKLKRNANSNYCFKA